MVHSSPQKSTRQQLVQANATLVTDIVALFRALGGGWNDPGTRSQTPDVPQEPPPLPAALDSVAAGVVLTGTFTAGAATSPTPAPNASATTAPAAPAKK